MSDNLNLSSIEEILRRDGEYVCTTSGSSMEPMLRDRRDTVVIRPMACRAKKYDVVLYRSGGVCVLHRVIKVMPEAYIICGDNRVVLEKDVRDEDIIGVLSLYYKGEKKKELSSFGYKLYCRYIVAAYYPRKFFRKLRSFLSLLKKKMLGGRARRRR